MQQRSRRRILTIFFMTNPPVIQINMLMSEKKLRELARLDEAQSAALVAFDLLDVFDESKRDKVRLKNAVQSSFSGLSQRERDAIVNWVAALVDAITPKG